MNNFEIIKLNNEEDNILIVMKTSEPPFDFLSEMEEALRNIQYLGYVTIDELLHSGNTEERFIQGFFNGNSFEKNYLCSAERRGKASVTRIRAAKVTI